MGIVASLKKLFLGIELPDYASEINATDKREWRLIDIIWWPVETEGQAKQAVFVCLIFSCYKALNSTANLIFDPSRLQSGYGFWNIATNLIPSISSPVIGILIAWGLFRMNRGAAIAGLFFNLVGVIWSIYGLFGVRAIIKWDLPIAFHFALLSFLYLQGIRGVNAYRSLCHNKTVSIISEP